ncbi:unnamed protein product [Effrenium voratum]|nr:unnamed protein product [Effrenium voratum]
MRGALVGLAGAVREMQRVPSGSGYNDDAQLPTLLSPRKSPKKERAQKPQGIAEVSWDKFLPDYNAKLGTGAYGGVYTVQGNPDKVVKLFDRGDWNDVMKETVFAQDMKARDPVHFVDCIGVGNSPVDDGKIFAVFERAAGITLNAAAHCFRSPDGINHVGQALDVLDQLTEIMMRMMKPDKNGQLHFHLDLKPDNIMIARDATGKPEFQVTLIDYGVVRTCKMGDADVHDAALQVFRWLGWLFLWMLASENFTLDDSLEKNPWDLLPEGFRPFFKRSDFRPPAYRSEKLSAGLLRDALQDGFFDQAPRAERSLMRVECVAALAFAASARTLACKVMSPAFRQQWTSPSKAKQLLGSILGDLFYGAAWQTCPRSACGDGKGLANESGGVGQRLLFRVLSGLREVPQRLQRASQDCQ